MKITIKKTENWERWLTKNWNWVLVTILLIIAVIYLSQNNITAVPQKAAAQFSLAFGLNTSVLSAPTFTGWGLDSSHEGYINLGIIILGIIIIGLLIHHDQKKKKTK